jgi:predicted lipid-binding transport protein (Tim44 family)
MMASYADIIFFAVVAIYLGIKLFSVLGKKNEQDSNLEARGPKFAVPETVGEARQMIANQNIKAPEVAVKNNLNDFKFSSEEVKSGIKEIIEKDNSFSLGNFIEGAKIALEMLLKAFSEGDKKTLKGLLSDEIYATFEKQLDALSASNHVATKSLVGIDDIEIVSALVSGSRVKIGLKFMTEQISITKDSNGNVIEGDAKKIEHVEDAMEFERNARSSNPNWTIVSL